MEWMSFAISGTLVSTLVLTAVLGYLCAHNRQRCLRIWTVGWEVYALRLEFMLAGG